MSKLEILAPVGSEESLKAAVLSGAKAVYLGFGNFNARRNAQNFTDEQLKEAIKYCHSRGVKVHITLNTLIKDCEINEVYETIRKIASFGADAVIVQDLGVARAVKEICPELPMHASTQMSVGTLSGLCKLKSLGFSRAVLPRELSLNEIEFLCKHSPIELEVFIHGALCMCVSGQCLMSAVLGSRSGNRGLCAQPCRLPFKVENGTGHDLSLKDLSIISNIRKLWHMGVCAFKIEGRMKRPEYVSACVTACLKAANGEYNFDIEKDLHDLFSRSGFTDGYYEGNLGRQMFGYREKENVQSATKDLLHKYSSVYAKEKSRFSVDFTFSGEIGKPATLIAECSGYKVTVTSDVICEEPINRAISIERLREALCKCGGTQFEVANINYIGIIDYSLPVSVINNMRRNALELLSEKMADATTRKILPAPIPTEIISKNKRKIYCRFDNANQIPEDIDAHLVFVPLNTDNEIIKDFRYGIELPHGMFGNSEKVMKMLKNSSTDICLCHTLDAVAIAKQCGKKVVASPSMNIFNSLSMDVAKSLGINEVIVSNECTTDNFNRLSSPISKGITVYGRIPLMLTRNCPVKNGKTCNECKRNGEITDRMGIKFPVKCNMGYTEILNSRPIYMADRLNEIRECDILFFNFTTESPSEITGILNAYKNKEKPTGEFTRGLLYRGVE